MDKFDAPRLLTGLRCHPAQRLERMDIDAI